MQLTIRTVGTSWLSFGTARRRDCYPSHFERGLKPARPGLSLGVFRRFGTMAYIHAVASPNEVQLSVTIYYCIKIASRGKTITIRFRRHRTCRYGIGLELIQSAPNAMVISAVAVGSKSITSWLALSNFMRVIKYLIAYGFPAWTISSVRLGRGG
jgi:hypothetical protein